MYAHRPLNSFKFKSGRHVAVSREDVKGVQPGERLLQKSVEEDDVSTNDLVVPMRSQSICTQNCS